MTTFPEKKYDIPISPHQHELNILYSKLSRLGYAQVLRKSDIVPFHVDADDIKVITVDEGMNMRLLYFVDKKVYEHNQEEIDYLVQRTHETMLRVLEDESC